jgi:hypothetical protein
VNESGFILRSRYGGHECLHPRVVSVRLDAWWPPTGPRPNAAECDANCVCLPNSRRELITLEEHSSHPQSMFVSKHHLIRECVPRFCRILARRTVHSASMRLLDLIAQGRTGVIWTDDGRSLPGVERFTDSVRHCPLRYVLSDSSRVARPNWHSRMVTI